MCEDCEEADLLREVYLARRARMARTWRPKGVAQAGRWSADAIKPITEGALPSADTGPKLVAAE